jgi:glycosyltransferase involved in cell wall biosynthesis
MKLFEIATGYTSVPAKMGAATEIVVEELTKSFIKQSVDVEILDLSDSNRLSTTLPINEIKIPSFFVSTDTSLGILHKTKRVVYSVLLAKKLKQIIKNSDEKIVFHFHNQYNLFFFFKLCPKALRERVTIAYTVHSYIWHDKWDDIKNTVHIKYFHEVFAIENADYVFVLNKNAKKNITENIPCNKDRVFLINNGVNTETYHPLPKENIAEIKKQLGLNASKIFLQIGSVCDRKNQLEALKLLLPILKKNEDYIYAYGGGIISEEYQNSLISFTKENQLENQVVFLGELIPGETLNKYYAVSDLLVFPSKSEGFSLVIIEAMSAGLPVIVNKSLQFELSDKCLSYSSSQEFLSLAQRVTDDEEYCSSLTKTIRDFIVSNYNWNNVARQYLDILSEK